MYGNPSTNLEETFDKATKHLQTLAGELSSSSLLEFYAFYKQATVGPCDIPRPSWYQAQAKQKWEAWKNLGDMSRDTAMDSYIKELRKINPNWEEEEDGSAKPNSETYGWVAISRLTNTEQEINDAEKTLFDWVKEGNKEMVREILENEPRLGTLPDEEGLLPIHWAADRGYVQIIELLINKGANINSQDKDGQTALHYAASCGHLEAAKYLLSTGATSIRDNDGLEPKDIAADEQLIAIL